MRKVVIAVVALALVLVGFIAVRVRAQQEHGPTRGSGVVESEGVDLASRTSQRVLKVVAEGTKVAAGDVVVELVCDDSQARLAEARARLESARAQANSQQLQAEAATKTTRAARASVGAAAAQAAALQTQRDVAARDAARLESMGTHAPVAKRDQATSAASQLDARARAAVANQSVVAAKATASSMQANAADAQADAARRLVEATEAIVRGAELAVGECLIRSPRAGIVERVHYEVGELVMPGGVVARVIDPDVVRATFYVPNEDFDEVKVGQTVEVQADAYEDRTFKGRVDRVAIEAEFTPRNIQTRSDRDRLVYPVEVVIPNEDHRLRAGMPVVIQLGSTL